MSGLGGRERFETPGKEIGVSNQGGEGHKREADELDDYLGCTTSKVNSRWTIHLHVNSKTVKLLEESLGTILMVLGLAKIS